MILYKARDYALDITEEEYDHVTEAFAVSKSGTRDKLEKQYSALFERREDAVVWKRNQLRDAVHAAEDNLDTTKRRLAEFEKREGL